MKFPNHLFTTFIKYRKSVKGQKEYEVIEEINARFGLNYQQSNIHNFKALDRTIPDNVLKMINEELPLIIKWLIREDHVTINQCLISEGLLAEYLHVGVKKKG